MAEQEKEEKDQPEDYEDISLRIVDEDFGEAIGNTALILQNLREMTKKEKKKEKEEEEEEEPHEEDEEHRPDKILSQFKDVEKMEVTNEILKDLKDGTNESSLDDETLDSKEIQDDFPELSFWVDSKPTAIVEEDIPVMEKKFKWGDKKQKNQNQNQNQKNQKQKDQDQNKNPNQKNQKNQNPNQKNQKDQKKANPNQNKNSKQDQDKKRKSPFHETHNEPTPKRIHLSLATSPLSASASLTITPHQKSSLERVQKLTISSSSSPALKKLSPMPSTTTTPSTSKTNTPKANSNSDTKLKKMRSLLPSDEIEDIFGAIKY